MRLASSNNIIPTVSALVLIAILLTPTSAMQPWDSQIIQNGIPPFEEKSCTYSVYQDVPVVSGNWTYYALDCNTGLTVASSMNASSVFNSLSTLCNTNNGCYIHVKGYSNSASVTRAYNITAPILLPNSGHFNFVGEGTEFTVLRVPPNHDNDIFLFTGTKTVDSFFNYFSNFALFGNDGVGNGGVHNDGFKFNSTGFGMHDTLLFNVFVEHFKQDDYFANQFSIWNMRINQSTLEYGGNACINIAGDGTGAEMRITDSKIIFCNGIGLQVQATNNMQIINNWWYKNQKEDIKFIAATSFSENIQNNNFQNSGLATTNTYYQMNLAGLAYSVVEGNNFNSAPSGNKPIAPIFLGSASVKDVVVNNNSFGTFSYGTTSKIQAASGLNNLMVIDNVGTNPYNKITNFVDGSTLSPFGTTGTVVNGTTYTIDYVKALVTVSGGVGVSVTLLDGSGNTIQSSLATLTEQPIPVGYQIKITWVTIPTVTVYFQ